MLGLQSATLRDYRCYSSWNVWFTTCPPMT
ncbi:MAG: hypothetical protein QOI61_2281, partial [Actinomycetota bacterium]